MTNMEEPIVIDRKEERTLEIDNDLLKIKPLGAGQEVGRSCIYMEFKGKKILLDMGMHPGLNGMDSLPFVDMIDPEEMDLLLVSHFHLDHCGALPWFLKNTTFKGRCFMTHATKAIYRWLLADCIKVSNISTEATLYSEADLQASMDKIETINFHEEKEVGGVKFWCYNAGHVLGAAMFMIEIAGVKILYTGDFSRQEDRHLMSAEIPAEKPDVLIIEATYGTHIHEPRSEREARFTGIVYDTVTRGGRCLIPVFALGRAQELLLILDEFWSQHPELHDIPIYYASSLAKKCMSVYQTYINAMNDRIKKQIAISNPFVFKHISNLKSIDHFEDVGPCVVMASPGMMQSGLSRELFEAWCGSRRNTCIIAGYCVEGTLAKYILSEPEEIPSLIGQKLPRRCQVEYISFSAHTDYRQTSEFIRALRPPHIVLVHGEANEMNRLKLSLMREYEDTENPPMLHNPKNTATVELHFRGERIAKVMGSLAIDPPKDGHRLSGILVKQNFNYLLHAPSDLHKYTQMSLSHISQKLSIPYEGDMEMVIEALSSFPFEKLSHTQVKVFNQTLVSLVVKENVKYLLLEWKSSPMADTFADTLIALFLKKTLTKKDLKQLTNQGDTNIDDEEEEKVKPKKTTLKHSANSKAKEMLFVNFLIETLGDMFGLAEEAIDLKTVKVEPSEQSKEAIKIDQPIEQRLMLFTLNELMLDGHEVKNFEVVINITTKQVDKCESDGVKAMITRLLNTTVDLESSN